jgi:hypothetical protein
VNGDSAGTLGDIAYFRDSTGQARVVIRDEQSSPYIPPGVWTGSGGGLAIGSQFDAIKFYSTANGDTPVERMRIVGSNGNIGIGVTNPQTNLHLVGVGNNSGPRLRFETLNNGNAQYTASGKEIGGIQFAADDHTWATSHVSSEIVGIHYNPNYDGAQGDLVFKTSSTQGSSPTEKMRIRYDGNVGININNPPAKMYVKINGNASMGNAWGASDFVVSHGVGTTAPSQSLGVAMGVDGTGDASSSRGYLWCMRPNLSWNTLKIQGNKLELIGLASVTLNNGNNVTSDDRLKTEEEFLQNALPTIMKLKPQTYRKHPFLPNDPSKEVTENMTDMPSDLSRIETGLIVQDIWYDAPELRHLVKLGDNANPPEVRPVDPDPSDPTQDPDYSSWGTTPTTLEYQGVFVVAIKAIQELTLKNDALEARIAALENNISS